ncbi:MAG: sprT domain-containing protein [Sphingomonadales bacterium]|nr:sprT domain-containing protein [Sphingomonadales bacterium]
MQHKRDQFISTLSKFAPADFAPYLADCILAAGVQFKIVPGRKTKLGDFRSHPLQRKPIITVNGDLNPYSFLITSLHEIAHLDTYRQYGFDVEPHGLEWKNAFRHRLIPLLESKQLPPNLQRALEKSFTKLKAASGSDLHLSRILKTFDARQVTLLEQLPIHAEFILQNKYFIKGELRRTRYLCTEKSSKRVYLIHALAAVTTI